MQVITSTTLYNSPLYDDPNNPNNPVVYCLSTQITRKDPALNSQALGYMDLIRTLFKELTIDQQRIRMGSEKVRDRRRKSGAGAASGRGLGKAVRKGSLASARARPGTGERKRRKSGDAAGMGGLTLHKPENPDCPNNKILRCDVM